MREFQGQRRRRQIMYSLPVRVLLALLIILLSGSIYRLYEKQRLVSAERRSFLKEVERLRARQTELAQEVAKLGTERGVEEEIRENFNVVKPGEKVITFVIDEAATSTLPVTPSPWWQKIIEWFK